MESARLAETEDARPASGSPGAPGARLYVLVLEGHTSRVVALPWSGAVVIGRAPGSGIQVEDPSVSKQHARLVLVEGEAHAVDLESRNGIRVNGEPLDASQALQSGDVLALGNVTLVFHSGSPPAQSRPLLNRGALKATLLQELDRVLSYEHTLSLIALDLGGSTAALGDVVQAASGALRLMDVVGEVGRTRSALLVVLPGLSGDEAEAVAAGVMDAVRALAPEVRAGLVSAPRDGLDAEALMASARARAFSAPAGSLQVDEPGSYRLQLGARSVLVADPAMVNLYELLRRLAASSIPILIHGETGAGKEHAAWAVHHWSPRSGKPFCVLNCATLKESLAESELFGHERGAFSGADRSHPGLFESADGGTIFLDEVAELPLDVQPKLLRALEEKRIRRLGDSREREVDVRIVAATHRILADEVEAGRFRRDLLYRLSGGTVVLPPLRDRARELPLLARTFLSEACAQLGVPALELSAAAMGALTAHHWPGNVRELKNALEYAAAAARADGPFVELSHLPESCRPRDLQASPTPAGHQVPGRNGRAFRRIGEELRELERRRMIEALEETGGVQNRAAELIGMALRTFMYKVKQYKIPAGRKLEDPG